jgi:acyl-CoA thioesterase-1
MRIRIALHALSVVLLGCAVGACGGGSATGGNSGTGSNLPPVTTPAVPTPTIAAGTWVVIGSSTAAGAGAASGKGWVDLLQTNMTPHGAQIANIAVGGSVTYHGLSAKSVPVSGRPQPNPAANVDEALSRKPVLLIVSYPTNDTALGYSVDETVNNILAIRRDALAAGVAVVVTSSQPRYLPSGQLQQLKAIDERLTSNVGSCFVDVGTALSANDGRLASQFDAGDGVHPNEAGHRAIAARMQQVLESGACVRLTSATSS